nr:hypothetical protein BaRGS_024483 [Batillaria attramentaria]
MAKLHLVLSALIGFSGAMVYVGHWKDDIEDSDGLLNFAWAFAMNVGACALAIIAAIILFFANKNLVETKDSELEAPLPMEWTSTWEAQPGPAGPAVISHNALRPKYPGWEMGIPDPMLRNHYVPDPTTAGYVHRPRPSGRGSGKKYAEYPPEPYPSYPYPYATRGFAPVPVPSHHTRRPAYEQEGDVLYSNVAPYYEEEVMAVAAAPRPAPVVRMSPVVLPRLVIRGQYEPGYGYQEYRFQ